MSGSYCQFCGYRCFVDRVVPDGPQRGWRGHMATCLDGMAHDLNVLGHTHLTAINPITKPEAAKAVPALKAPLTPEDAVDTLTGAFAKIPAARALLRTASAELGRIVETISELRGEFR